MLPASAAPAVCVRDWSIIHTSTPTQASSNTSVMGCMMRSATFSSNGLSATLGAISVRTVYSPFTLSGLLVLYAYLATAKSSTMSTSVTEGTHKSTMPVRLSRISFSYSAQFSLTSKNVP